MEKTKIIPNEKHRTIDYSTEIVKEFWKQKVTKNYATGNHKQAISDILRNIDEGFICIYSEKLSDKELIEQIFYIASKSNTRVYILVNEHCPELETLHGVSLIRYDGLQNVGSFILVNPKSNVANGLFFGGQLTEESLLKEHFSRELDKEEISELFKHFCYQFWENAKQEVFEKEKHNPVKSKPLDIYYDKDKYSGKDYVWGTLFDFVESEERGQLSQQKIVFLNQENKFIEIKSETQKDLRENKMSTFLPKDEFENKEPELKDDNENVSVKINFCWKNIPYYLPVNMKRHNIYSQWEDETEKIEKKTSSMLEDISNMEKQGNTLSQKLMKFFLGKKVTFEKLKAEIKDIQNVNFPNIPKEERDKYINRINEIIQEISGQRIEIDKEKRKAKLEEEIDVLKSKIEEKNKEISEKEDDFLKKENDKKNAIQEFCDKNGIESTKFNTAKEEYNKNIETLNKQIQELPKDKEEEKKNLEDELSSIKKKMELIAEIQKKDIFINKAKDEKEKIEKEKRSLEYNIESTMKDIQKIESENQSSGESVLEAFDKKSKKQQKQGYQETFKINLPQLPQTGELFQGGGEKYLAIEFWEDYEKGKAEAERFDAKLCAKQ